METLSAKLAPVFAAIWQDAGIHRLRIAPDGMLNLAPFAAISDSHGHFLVERVAISYLSAGRDLAAPLRPASASANVTIVIALSPGARRRRTQANFDHPGRFAPINSKRLAGGAELAEAHDCGAMAAEGESPRRRPSHRAED